MVVVEPAATWSHADAPVPVTVDDPIWGNPLAPVTVVVFTDYQCPFCSKLHSTLRILQDAYGEARLRIVFKHNPLPFHDNARSAAIAAETVRALGGNRAFWIFSDLAFSNQTSLQPQQFEEWARIAGVDPIRLRTELQNETYARKVDEDAALAARLGARGTPTCFVDGVQIVGAQPPEKFTEVIDAHQARAATLVRQGTPADRVYSTIARDEWKPAPPAGTPSTPPAASDTNVWKVPVGIAPVRGPANALATIVVFSDFQCPFCARASGTMQELLTRYPNDVRIVWKDRPMAFHQRAKAAAIFAREARAQKGDRAFWTAHDKLFANTTQLEEEDLARYGGELGLNVPRLRNSIKSNAFAAQIGQDEALATSLNVTGTPTFFVNGRRLVGAQPIDKFVKIVDEELIKARALVRSGTAASQVYARIQRDAKVPTAAAVAAGGAAEPEKKTLPAPGAGQPSRGGRNAAVVIQMFSDFQCPYCARVEPTLAELEKKYGSRLKIVWRNLPLAFHNNAQLAAEAAMEAFAQKGGASFWQYHDKLFAHQGDPGGLERPALEAYASELGLNLVRFRNALDNHTHAAAVKADADIATAAGISGTPSFVINGYALSGAQPQAEFERLIDRVLGERRH